MTLRDDIRAAINRHSAENGSNTPDGVLADYLVGCLEAFDAAVRERERLAHGSPFTEPVRCKSHGQPDCIVCAMMGKAKVLCGELAEALLSQSGGAKRG